MDQPSNAPKVPATRGRPFANGNPGRTRGSRNRTTIVAAALLEGEAQQLVRKGVELAMDGDVVMLKFLIGRILPRERLVKLELPRMEFADDAVEALGRILRAVSEGRISPSEGSALAGLINSYTHAIDMADAVKRMDALEAQVRGGAWHEPDSIPTDRSFGRTGPALYQKETADRRKMAADS